MRTTTTALNLTYQQMSYTVALIYLLRDLRLIIFKDYAIYNKYDSPCEFVKYDLKFIYD